MKRREPEMTETGMLETIVRRPFPPRYLAVKET